MWYHDNFYRSSFEVASIRRCDPVELMKSGLVEHFMFFSNTQQMPSGPVHFKTPLHHLPRDLNWCQLFFEQLNRIHCLNNTWYRSVYFLNFYWIQAAHPVRKLSQQGSEFRVDTGPWTLQLVDESPALDQNQPIKNGLKLRIWQQTSNFWNLHRTSPPRPITSVSKAHNLLWRSLASISSNASRLHR